MYDDASRAIYATQVFGYTKKTKRTRYYSLIFEKYSISVRTWWVSIYVQKTPSNGNILSYNEEKTEYSYAVR